MRTITVMRDGRPATEEELMAAVEGRPLPPVRSNDLVRCCASCHDYLPEWTVDYRKTDKGECMSHSNSGQSCAVRSFDRRDCWHDGHRVDGTPNVSNDVSEGSEAE